MLTQNDIGKRMTFAHADFKYFVPTGVTEAGNQAVGFRVNEDGTIRELTYDCSLSCGDYAYPWFEYREQQDVEFDLSKFGSYATHVRELIAKLDIRYGFKGERI